MKECFEGGKWVENGGDTEEKSNKKSSPFFGVGVRAYAVCCYKSKKKR